MDSVEKVETPVTEDTGVQASVASDTDIASLTSVADAAVASEPVAPVVSEPPKEVVGETDSVLEKIASEVLSIVDETTVESSSPPAEVSAAAPAPEADEVKTSEVENGTENVIEAKTVEIESSVENVVDQFENLTVFGNKSLDELQKIQSKKSHLSAGTAVRQLV